VKSDASSLAQLYESRQRGVEWILRHLDDDGRPVGAAENNKYYRVPWALAVAGERGAAATVLSWIEEHALEADGDLRDGPPREHSVYRFASYPLAIIAIGAWYLNRYDTGNAMMDLLEERYQDPVSGGAFTLRPEVRSTSRQDLFPTAQLGYTALMTGRQAMADKAYGWFCRLYDAQPSLPDLLYTTWDDSGLVTEVGDEDRFDLVTDLRAPRQAFYNPGIAAAFLGRFGAATRTSAPFDLARSFLVLSEHGTPAQFDYSETRQICKYGWGAAVMLEFSPDGKEFLPAVERMADWFRDCQDADGSWTNSPFINPHPTDADRLEVTAEFVLHTSTILTALRASPRPYAAVLARTESPARAPIAAL
jgi:hypothetical protein